MIAASQEHLELPPTLIGLQRPEIVCAVFFFTSPASVGRLTDESVGHHFPEIPHTDIRDPFLRQNRLYLTVTAMAGHHHDFLLSAPDLPDFVAAAANALRLVRGQKLSTELSSARSINSSPFAMRAPLMRSDSAI